MCGIFGFSKVSDLTIAMAPILALEMEARGDDSWGTTNGEAYYKQPCSIIDGFHTFQDWKQWDSAIFHTRGASVGNISADNAHPFFDYTKDEKLVIGVHNGHVAAWKEMNTKYKRECRVDSEHIFKHLAAGLDLKELDASGAVVWYEDGRLSWVVSESGSLEVVVLPDDSIVICSTMSAILKATRWAGVKIKNRLSIKARDEYYFDLNKEGDKKVIWHGQTTNFGKTVVDYTKWAGVRNVSNIAAPKPNCVICYRQVEDVNAVVCRACHSGAVYQVAEWMKGKDLKGNAGHAPVGYYVN